MSSGSSSVKRPDQAERDVARRQGRAGPPSAARAPAVHREQHQPRPPRRRRAPRGGRRRPRTRVSPIVSARTAPCGTRLHPRRAAGQAGGDARHHVCEVTALLDLETQGSAEAVALCQHGGRRGPPRSARPAPASRRWPPWTSASRAGSAYPCGTRRRKSGGSSENTQPRVDDRVLDLVRLGGPASVKRNEPPARARGARRGRPRSGRNITPNWHTTRSKLSSSWPGVGGLQAGPAAVEPWRCHRRVQVGGRDLGVGSASTSPAVARCRPRARARGRSGGSTALRAMSAAKGAKIASPRQRS